MIAKIFVWIISISMCTKLVSSPLIPASQLKKIRPRISTLSNKANAVGSFSSVYEGMWKTSEDHAGALVAIKVFNLKTLPPHLISEFEPFTRVSHPHIVDYFGICTDPEKFMMISELLPFSLREYLEHNYQRNWETNWEILHQVASALSYLHSIDIAHKHIKSSNILLKRNPVTGKMLVKINDFGLSKIKLESSSANEGKEATLRWRAPETFTREYARVKDNIESSSAADIYSFGMVAWELASGSLPFVKNSESQVVQLLTGNTQEKIDPSWPAAYQELLNNCWKFVPKARWSAEKIIEYIDEQRSKDNKLDVQEVLPESGWSVSVVKNQFHRVLWRSDNINELRGYTLFSPTPNELRSYKMITRL